MATSAELISLYGDLRATLLARHFAVGRYFRANYVSIDNRLGVLHAGGSPSSGDIDDRDLGCDREIVRPSTYASAVDLLGKDSATQTLERWRVADHDRENPLLFSGQLLICLAVEHHLGRRVAPIIKTALHSIATMYKFDQEHFRGYPIRYDAITSDHWVTRSENGRVKPRYCCRFFLSPDRNSYLYCTPFQNPRYTPFIPVEQFKRMREQEKMDYHNARQRSLSWHRRWEPSMDELVGLIMGYDIVFRLVDDQDIRDEVRRQVNNLGDYLAEHGYLLVRPGGGFTALGASGAIPAFEFPWQRVFERITGNRYEPRVGFEGACGKAGVWDCLAGPVAWATVAGVVVAVAVSVISTWLVGGILGGVIGILALITGIPLGIIVARALAILSHSDCFDVWAWPGYKKDELDETGKRKEPQKDTRAQDEFVLAYLLKKLPLVFRFRSYVDFLAKHKGGWTAQHPPYVALTGLGDADGTVRSAYLAFLPERRKHSLAWEAPWVEGGWHHECDMYAANPFASAVAVVLGAGEDEERNLVQLLHRWYVHLVGHGRDWELADGGGGTVMEGFRPALPFMAALALSWLHAKRRADAGSPPPAAFGFPVPPTTSDLFPEPRIPRTVRDKAASGEVVLPEDTWGDAGWTPGSKFSGNLFDTSTPPPKQGEPPPPDLKPPEQKQLLPETTITVSEADWDVDTGVELNPEDEYVIEASGEIWAGVWATGTNGPDGWRNIEYDHKFPVHGWPDGHPYALIGKVGANGYFFVGSRFPKNDPDRELYLGPGTQRLWLRTNDDVPGNGSKREPGKAFTCRIKVWR